MRGAQAIGAGVSASDNDDILSRCADAASGVDIVSLVASVLLREKLHREVNASQFPSWYAQVTRLLGASREEKRVVFAANLLHFYIHANVSASNKSHALSFHLLQAPINDVLLEFEIRDSVAEQSADAIRPFEDGNCVTCPPQLLSGS